MTERFEDRVTLAIADHVAEVRLDRPDKLNALDPAMFAGIIAVLARLADARDVRCVVLHGAGRAFCAGLDLASMGADAAGDLAMRTHGIANRFQQVAWGWRALPMPVIAAAHGVAFGGGLQIMSGADMVIAAPDTRLAVMEIKWGIVPDMAGFALWRGRVRDDHLRHLAYTAREFDAREACDYGFVSTIESDPLAAARTLAREIAARNPAAVRAIKAIANAAVQEDAAAILRHESAAQQVILGSANQRAAVAAALTGQDPRFGDD